MEAYLKELKPYIYITVLLFFGAALLGYFITASSPQEALYLQEELTDLESLLSDFSSVTFFIFIFLNNAIKIFLTVLLGAGFAIFPLIFVFTNGYFIGSVAFLARESMGWPSFLLAIAPHGVMELPAFFLAAAIGFLIGARVLSNIFRGAGFSIKKEISRGMGWFFRIILPVILIAAFVEVFITPAVIGLVL